MYQNLEFLWASPVWVYTLSNNSGLVYSSMQMSRLVHQPYIWMLVRLILLDGFYQVENTVLKSCGPPIFCYKS